MKNYTGKKGQGLPLTTIILFIIVVVVLVMIIAFFLGGTTTITNTIKNIFFGVTAGTDKTLAIENCRQYCDQSLVQPAASTRKSSVYCTQYFKIDNNGDGEADYDLIDNKKEYHRWYCWPGAESGKPSGFSGEVHSLQVPCDLGKERKGNEETSISCSF